MAAQPAAKHTGNGAGKAGASADGNGAFDAIFATMMAGRRAAADGQTADAASGTAPAQPDDAGAAADTTSPAAKQLLQALNASTSTAALASAGAAPAAPSAKTKSDAKDAAAKDGDKGSQDQTAANDKAQIHVSPNAIARASETAKAQAAASAVQAAANDAGQATDKKTAQTADNTDHAGKSDTKKKKADKAATDQPAADLLAVLGMPAAQPQAAAPQNTAKTGQDIVGDATAPKAKAAAGTTGASGNAGATDGKDGAAAQAGTGQPGTADPQIAANAPTSNGAAKPGAQDKPAPSATTAIAQTTPAETALQDVLAALGARSAQASKVPAAQNGASDKAKPAQGQAQTPQSATAAVSGQAVAAANGGKNAASDNGGHDNGAPAHHASAGDVASAKPAPHAAQAAFQLPQHGATATTTTANTAGAAPFAAQPATAAMPGHVAAQIQVAAQTAAQAQQAVPAHDFGALALNIAAHSTNGAQHFSIALHPADLGHIHVQLSVDHSGAAQAHLSADNQQTLQLLQQNGHHLERALKDTGLNLAGGGLNFSLKGQQQQNSGGQSGQGRGRALAVSAVASSDSTTATAASQYNLAPGSARLDIKV